MRKDVRLDGWRVTAQSPSFENDFFESVFFTGNGRMGLRGYAAGNPAPRPVKQGLFVAGMFDEIKPGITDFIHLPTPAWHRVLLNGSPGKLLGQVETSLDLSCGLLTHTYTLAAEGAAVRVCEQRFFDPQRPALLAQRLCLHSDGPVAAAVETGVLTASCNCPVPDDQVKENTETVQLMRAKALRFTQTDMIASFESRVTKLTLTEQLAFGLPPGWTRQPLDLPGRACGITAVGRLPAGGTAVLEKLCCVTTSRDKDERIAPLPAGESFDALLAAAKRAWRAKWTDCALRIQGDPQSEAALRYTVYELLVNCSARDDTVSIGARGLTHTRYKGCYFWDTDLFMMPFYLYSCPEAAQSLERYRVNCLPAAKAHAAKMNGAGARYPWMAAYDGSEQCESWDIGASELHVTADVVFALDQYLQATGDARLQAAAREVYVETARFWASRYTPDPAGGVNLLFCKGPDEYCGITSNNLFTNFMVRRNLELALDAARQLQAGQPEAWERLGLTESELTAWETLRAGIRLPRDPETGRWRADDTFHLLEPVDLHTLKPDQEASYHQVCFDRLQRYKVIKQADVLLLMSRMPEAFTQKEKLDAWEDFEPLCLHDSTLSFASHALFAAQNGLTGPAWEYFQKALYLDLWDGMGNTGKEGLHLACLGEVWQAVILGFAGLYFTPDGPAFRPALPAGWQRLEFHFYWRGTRYHALVGPTGGSCTVQSV